MCYAQSTGVTRTKMSLELVMAGLWRPKNTPNEWNKNLNWQPIDINYENLDDDTLLLVRTTCPRYHEELTRVFAESDYRQIIEDNQEMFHALEQITGLSITSLDDIQSLFSTLKAEKEYGINLPRWTKKYYPNPLQKLTELSYIYNVYNDELKKLKGGPFLKKLISDWSQYTTGTIKPKNRKMYVYAGHDSTIVNILSAFNVWQRQLPNYGIMAIFEFYENTITGKFGVKVSLPYRRLLFKSI